MVIVTDLSETVRGACTSTCKEPGLKITIVRRVIDIEHGARALRFCKILPSKLSQIACCHCTVELTDSFKGTGLLFQMKTSAKVS